MPNEEFRIELGEETVLLKVVNPQTKHELAVIELAEEHDVNLLGQMLEVARNWIRQQKGD